MVISLKVEFEVRVKVTNGCQFSVVKTIERDIKGAATIVLNAFECLRRARKALKTEVEEKHGVELCAIANDDIHRILIAGELKNVF